MGHPQPEGDLFLSYFCRKTGAVSRQLIPISPGRNWKQVRVQVKRSLRGPRELSKKLQGVHSAGADLPEIMEKIQSDYLLPNDKAVIAGMLTTSDSKRQVWINPEMLDVHKKLETARKEKSIVENNGAQPGLVKFWSQLETLYALNFSDFGFWTRATTAMVEAEIYNFSRGFDVRL